MVLGPQVNILSLCSGIGGLDLGVKLAEPSARTVCYVEWEPYAACVLAERMAEGRLDSCPVYCDDLRRFDAKQWAGVVDCVIAGFPCQPFSVAGKQRGIKDERWLWSDIVRIVQDCGASLVFLENVPPILAKGGFIVLEDIAKMGWSAEWGMFRAEEVGAPHKRERWFCLAMADRNDTRQCPDLRSIQNKRNDPGRSGYAVGNTNGNSVIWLDLGRSSMEQEPLDQTRQIEDEHGPDESGEHGVGDADRSGLEGHDWLQSPFRFPPGYGTPREEWFGPEPAICRESYGLSGRLDCIKALGNAVVPQQVALAWRVLSERLKLA